MIQGGRSISLAIFACALIVAGASASAARAQEAASTHGTKNTMVSAYDLSKEVKVEGTIEKIDGFGPNGPIGTHILIQTATGTVDAHLGFGAAANPQYLGISVGQKVAVVGMMQTVGNSAVLMARILTTPSRIVVLRNEHGIPVRGAIHRNLQPGTWYSVNAAGRYSHSSWALAAQRGGL